MLYQIKELNKLTKFIHAFSTVDEGNMSFRWGKTRTIQNNRINFLKSQNIKPSQVVTAQLEHNDKISIVTINEADGSILNNDYKLEADALITNEPNLFLFHIVADCASLLIFDPIYKAAGLAHCGWRNTDLALPIKVIDALKNNFHSNPMNLLIGIGPALHECCYAYHDHEVLTKENWQPYLKQDQSGLYHIDNIKYITKQLLESGIQPQNLFTSNICTGHDKKFFSHYHDKKTGLKDQGRFASIIGFDK
jgi:YfiH family protein